MARTQLIFTDNPGDLPASYTFPPGLAVALSSVYARIDGSGAGSDFRPVLDLLSQNGHLIARVAVQQTFVAGDSGRVTWAPFLKPSATTSAGGTKPSVAKLSASLTGINAGTVPWDSFSTNDTAVFNTAATNGGAINNTAGDQYLRIDGGGMLWVFGGAIWATPTAGQQAVVGVVSSNVLDQYQLSEAQVISSIYGQGNWAGHGLFLPSGASPEYLSLAYAGGGGTDADFTLGVAYLAADNIASVF